MSYLAVRGDGSTVELGNITGYQVHYRRGKKAQRSRPFNFIWQAVGFQKGLKMGQQSKIVPVYAKGKGA